MRGARAHHLALPLVSCLISGATASCRPDPKGSPPDAVVTTAGSVDDMAVLSELRVFEEQARSAARFDALPPSSERLGADPYAIQAVHDGSGFIGVLRGASAIVELDLDLRETKRHSTIALPDAIAIAESDVWIGSELEPRLAHYRRERGHLTRLADVAIPGPVAVRALAVGPEGIIYAADEVGDRILVVNAKTGALEAETKTCRAPIDLVRTDHFLVVNCLLEHTVAQAAIDKEGKLSRLEAIAHHDGPIWSLSAMERDDALFVFLGGVEDAPLDRSGGFFGNIDSFFFGYRSARGTTNRFAAINLSEAGVVTPKTISLASDVHGIALTVYGYGGGQRAGLRVDTKDLQASIQSTITTAPGIRAVAQAGNRIVAASPLLDAWIRIDGEPVVHRIGEAYRRDEHGRVGEALFFTSAMAPWNSSDGKRSRFTCETCHFEGYIDGRTHHTGRGDIRATTKPLLGLFNNRPHFSRALDPDLSSVAHNEFRVAGAESGHSPWFSLNASTLPSFGPWLGSLLGENTWSASELRIALMTFLMEFSHRPSALTFGRQSFSSIERKGAHAFARRCASCHAARLSADRADSEVALVDWERFIFSPSAPIVWASSRYEKTGITPYVHENGARVPSLRRLYKKWPYFTNGSAHSLRDVLQGARARSDEFWHANAPGDARSIDPIDAEAIEAFLRLL